MIRISAATFGLIAALLVAGLPAAGGSGLLENGGFEQGSSGWSVTAGQLESVGSPVHGGALAGRFSGSSQPTTQFVYQLIGIQPAQSYELNGWVAASGPSVNRVFLRLSWFDLHGQLLLSEDSPWLAQADAAFHLLSTGVRTSPATARSARISALVQSDSGFNVHLDDFAFSGPAAIPPPPSTPTPAPDPMVTPAPPPAPATPLSTPKPTPAPTRTAAPQPTAGPAGGATPAPAAEPVVFSHLVNGGFEQLRPDGTPYGWRKQGGEIVAVNEPRTEGARAGALTSHTDSTKWLYQTVTVRDGAYYEATVDARAGPGSESAFIRLSWYASADGSGQAMSSSDSRQAATPANAGFLRLTTGAVAAPPGAGTVKVRLMLRPASEDAATAYFDSVALAEALPQDGEVVRGRGGTISAAGRGGGAPPIAGTSVEAGAAPPTSVTLANVKPPRPDSIEPSSAGGGGSDEWAILLALGIAISAIGLAGGYELWQRRGGGGGGVSNGP